MKKSKAAKTKPLLKYRVLSDICSLCGTLILLVIIGISLPLSVPRFFGYEIYDVVSGSMEPTIMMGSIVYVEHAEAQDLKPEEIIAFYDKEHSSVIIHRVKENHTVEGELVTKGDANNMEDIGALEYDRVLGRVVFHAPLLGRLSSLYTSPIGKVYAMCFAFAALLFFILGSQVRDMGREEAEMKAIPNEVLDAAIKRARSSAEKEREIERNAAVENLPDGGKGV